jgi:hypothetical protein
MPGFRSRRTGVASLAVLAVAAWLGPATSKPEAQGRAVYWYSVAAVPRSPLSDRIESLLQDYLAGVGLRVVPQRVAPAALAGELRRRLPDDPAFVYGDLGSLDTALAAEGSASPFGRLNLELINARLSSAPFYLLGRADTLASLASLRGVRVRVGYSDQTGRASETDVENMLRPLLGVQDLDAIRIDSPALMARRLLAEDQNRIHFAGVYDDEPSLFLHRFLLSYNRARPLGDAGRALAAHLWVLPTSAPGYEANRVRASAGVLDYVIVRYSDQRFYTYDEFSVPVGDSGVIAISKRAGSRAGPENFPVILTNAKRTLSQFDSAALVRALTDVYLVALFEGGAAFGGRCRGAAPDLVGTYLLNAYLGDPANRFKSLGLLAHHLLMSTTPRTDRSRYDEQARMVEDVLQREQAMPGTEGGRLVPWLTPQAPPPTAREAFSGDTASMYQQALDAIRLGLAARDATRLAALQRARRLLVSAIRGASLPKCELPGRGLWSAKEYDPYFHLALIESYERLHPSR